MAEIPWLKVEDSHSDVRNMDTRVEWGDLKSWMINSRALSSVRRWLTIKDDFVIRDGDEGGLTLELKS